MTRSEIAYELTKTLMEKGFVKGNYDDGNKSMANEVVTIFNTILNGIGTNDTPVEDKTFTAQIVNL